MTVEDEFDAEVRGLLESEGRAPVAPPGVRGRVAARLASTLAASPPMGSSRGARSWGAPHAAAVVSAFAVGVATGVFGVLALHPPPAVPAPRSAPAAVSAPSSAASSIPLSDALPAPAPSALSSASPPSPPLERPLHAEQSLLDAARVALARGDGAAALDAATSHARRFPHGKLSEERDAIAVQALVLLGRDREARAGAERFQRAYPDSALLPALREALGPPP